MGLKRYFRCDCCGRTHEEKNFGEGAPDWTQIKGVNLNGVDNPMFCGECTAGFMMLVDNFVSSVREELDRQAIVKRLDGKI